MSKITPKQKPQLDPTSQETQFFRHPVKTARYHSKKTWFKIAASTLLLAVLGGMGTWIGSTSLDWMNHHHMMTDQQVKDYWQWRHEIPNLEEAVSNDEKRLNALEREGDVVGENKGFTNDVFTASFEP
jgi:hypothetical protein